MGKFKRGIKVKKKIVLLSIALMLFAGIVSASSINGDYQGMPIVKITSGDRVLETDEVPGFIYEGHTVVPISTLRQLGASVTWDAYGYSVDVKLPNEQQPTTNPPMNNGGLPSAQEIVKSLGKQVVEFVSTTSDGNGFDQLFLVVNFSLYDDNAHGLYEKSMDYAATTNYTQLKMEDPSGNQALVSISDIKDFKSGQITAEELQSRMKVTRPGMPKQTGPILPPTDNTTGDVVKSEIDGTFKGWTGKTIFKLTNGQIWEQAEYGYYYHYAYNPEVTIYKDGSSYIMLVDGVDEKLKVKLMK